MSLSGTHYSMSDRLAFLRQAGWPDEPVQDDDGDTNPLLVIMTAISEKESSGYSCAHSENPGGEDSWGIWQVNRYAWPQYSQADLCDPVKNATAALAIYRRQGLSAWGPYVTGIYSDAMPQAWTAYQSAGGQVAPGAKALSAGGSPIGSSGNLLIYGLAAVLLYVVLSD
jgi:hypothetical protein